MKRVIKIVLLAIFGIILIGGIGTAIIFKDEIKIIGSIKAIGKDFTFYEMTFTDSYYMDEVFEKGASTDGELAQILAGFISHGFYNPSEPANVEIGCSTICGKTAEGNMVWGRNFDWYDTVPIIVKSTPKNGYASISTCNFGNITGDNMATPTDIANKFLAVAAYYVPMDGVNEKGLCVADLEVNEGGMKLVDTDKTNITITMAIRLLLDKAATVDEAVQLLEQYDVCPSAGISHHLSVADATGKSVSIEFMDGKIVVVDTPCVTNFNLTNSDISVGGESAMERYLTLKKNHESSKGVLSADEIMQALKTVSKHEGEWLTRWSMVYEYQPGDISVQYCWNADYNVIFSVSLKEIIESSEK